MTPGIRVAPARALAAATLLAALLRFSTLDAKGFWGDEISTVHLVHAPLASMLGQVGDLESTPPLYYLLSWAWAQFVPTSEVGLRVLPAAFGVALVPVVYRLASELVSRRAALIAATLVACNPMLVWYSQEARSYSLLTLLTGLGLLAFLRALRKPTPASLALWAVVTSLALATHYFALFLLVPQAVWLLREHGRRPALIAALAAVAGAGLVLLPMALEQQSFHHTAWIAHSPLPARTLLIAGEFLVGFEAPSPLVLAAIAVVPAAAGLWLLRTSCEPRERRGALIVAWMAAAAVALPLALALFGLDYLDPRNVIGALVPLLIVLAAGFAAGGRWLLGSCAAAALCGLSLVVVLLTAFQPKFHSEAWREAAQALGPADANRAIVGVPVRPARKSLEFYLPASRMLPSTGRPVREIDVLYLPRQGSDTPWRPRRMPRPPLPAFRLRGRGYRDHFTLLRFTALRALEVRPRQLATLAPAGFAAVVLWQPDAR